MNNDLYMCRSSKSIEKTAAVDEDLESARPVYDYLQTQEEQRRIEARIRKVKHAINSFNISTVIPEFGMTVDEMLVYIPQLSERKKKLTEMASFLPKERVSNGYQATKIIEYTYTNYDLKKAADDLTAVSDELARAQTALDVINNSGQLEINF